MINIQYREGPTPAERGVILDDGNFISEQQADEQIASSVTLLLECGITPRRALLSVAMMLALGLKQSDEYLTSNGLKLQWEVTATHPRQVFATVYAR